MSQKATRAAASGDEKPQPSPVKDVKKKMAANAEKQALEKNGEKAEQKQKLAEKQNGDKKVEKPAEKQNGDNKKPADKPADKKAADKPADKKPEDKPADKKDKPAEKKTEVEKKDDNKAQTSKPDQKPESKDKPKQNGKSHNGVTDVTLASNGVPDEVLNGSTVSVDSDDEVLVVTDDHENDELFPELTYDDDTSDAEGFEVPTPESLSRSMTRRSQVKATRTPETPRPATDKPAEGDKDSSKDTKLLKLKDDAPERRLRSTDSPKKNEALETSKKNEALETSKKNEALESPKKNEALATPNTDAENGTMMEVVVMVEDCEEANRKPDTNFSKSRVKVSPYRRSGRIADQTASSLIANYTGNNTTMEMDITESSITSETAAEEGSYIHSLRNIRGRRSYKPHAEIKLTARADRCLPHTAVDTTRPTLPVVGRKRKPESTPEPATEATESSPLVAKRMRLLERVMSPFRRVVIVPSSTPLPARRNAQIVGINTDLPMSVPVAPEHEAIKVAAAAPQLEQDGTTAAAPATDRDGKRCVVM